MRNKYTSLFFVLIIAMITVLHPGNVHANGKTGSEAGIQERIIQQYGLDVPESSGSTFWSGGDLGISHPFPFVMDLGKMMRNPYAFVVQMFLYGFCVR